MCLSLRVASYEVKGLYDSSVQALCGMLDKGAPTAASRDASDACPKHSRTSHHGTLAPLRTETYQKLLTPRGRRGVNEKTQN